MKEIKKMVHSLYVSGEPIFQDGYWHVQWLKHNGGTHVMAFGWRDRQMAETHIQAIMQGY